MQHDADLAAWIKLSLVPGLGGQTLRKLLGAFGLPQQILAAGHRALASIVSAEIAARILSDLDSPAVDAALAWAVEDGHAVLTLADDTYPRPLLETPDPPALLYLRGRRELLALPGLAVVGSRNATPQGISNAEQFARAFSSAGLTIVSGLALGIDAAAHRGGLDAAGSTIAVLGTGADILYPQRNRALGERIAREGLIVSEFPLGTPPHGSNFPRRNRVISGLARGCLVVEAALASGSLITARLAAEQGREVFAMPGSIHSPHSKGCHALIKQGAKLVESAQDLLQELGIEALAAPPGAAAGVAAGLLSHMGYDPSDIDTLCARSGLTADLVSAMLLQLELDGKVASLPGGQYQRTS
ncbi:MAG: DNA-processing protein DprA [Burkholderiales bacterium]|nr:DNA-protecting protein DprA [Burkholderiales bacterium]MCJ7838469.1 DNA-processing protein DprA [Burkholderiales bacterium]